MTMTTAATAAPAPASSLLLGRIAVEKGYLGWEDLDRCVREQDPDPLVRPARRGAPLGELLVSHGCLSTAQLTDVLGEQQRRLQARAGGADRQEDALFGQLAVRERMVGREEVNAALRTQAAMAERGAREIPRLGRLLVERGHLAPEDVVHVLSRQAKAAMICTLCAARYNVVGAVPGRACDCRRCGGSLEPSPAPEALHADESVFEIP